MLQIFIIHSILNHQRQHLFFGCDWFLFKVDSVSSMWPPTWYNHWFIHSTLDMRMSTHQKPKHLWNTRRIQFARHDTPLYLLTWNPLQLCHSLRTRPASQKPAYNTQTVLPQPPFYPGINVLDMWLNWVKLIFLAIQGNRSWRTSCSSPNNLPDVVGQELWAPTAILTKTYQSSFRYIRIIWIKLLYKNR